MRSKKYNNQRANRKNRYKRQGRNNKRRFNLKGIFTAAAIVLIIVLIACIRYGAIYLIESHSDTTLNGVDVSSYQLDIDWDGLEDEGYAFAFIKATEGSSHVDGRFEEYWDGARKAGLKTGAYHFMSFDSSGKKQAKNFIKTVPKKRNALPPVVDVEMYGDYHYNPPTQKQLDSRLSVILEKLEKKYDKKPIIYTNTYVYEKYISGKYDEYYIWISNPDVPETLPDGKEWTFCQYSFTGTSPSVAGGEKHVDLNLFYGTKWDLRKLK